MSGIKDISGMVYGKLSVIRCVGTNKNRHSLWECSCECGNKTTLPKTALTSGNTASCGCLSLVGNKNDRLPYNQSAKNYVLKNYRLKGINRGYSYNLPKEFAESLLESNCYYCGASPDKKYRDFSYMGIDRVDNKRGYYTDNVVPCCSICNMAKRSLTVEKFKEWVYNIFDHMNARDIKCAR